VHFSTEIYKMKFLKASLSIFILFTLTINAQAMTLCNEAITVKEFYVYSDRDDSDHMDHLLALRLTKADGTFAECGGAGYNMVYIKASDPAYDSVVSLIYMAYSMNKTLQVYINPNAKLNTNMNQIGAIFPYN